MIIYSLYTEIFLYFHKNPLQVPHPSEGPLVPLQVPSPFAGP